MAKSALAMGLLGGSGNAKRRDATAGGLRGLGGPFLALPRAFVRGRSRSGGPAMPPVVPLKGGLRGCRVGVCRAAMVPCRQACRQSLASRLQSLCGCLAEALRRVILSELARRYWRV